MTFRTFFLFAAGFLFVGCAAPSTGDAEIEITESSESGLGSLSSMLRAQTALDRARAVDTASGSVEVAYAPSPYERSEHVAFEAVTFAAEAATEVSVAGDFPSSATVVVTNDRFEPLAVSRTTRSAASGVGRVTVRVPAGGGMVLVRDPKWVKPMTFEVSVRGR